jgi:hypothetical protein
MINTLKQKPKQQWRGREANCSLLFPSSALEITRNENSDMMANNHKLQNVRAAEISETYITSQRLSLQTHICIRYLLATL